MRQVINTYNGWDEVVYFSEEMKAPERTLPRAVATGIGSVAILYLLINLALLNVLTPAQMAGSNSSPRMRSSLWRDRRASSS